METALPPENLQEGTVAIGFGGHPQEPSAMRGCPMFELLCGLETRLNQRIIDSLGKGMLVYPGEKRGLVLPLR